MTVYPSNVFGDQDVRSSAEAERTRPTSRISGCPGPSAQCGHCVRTTCLMDETLVGAEDSSDACDGRVDVPNGAGA
jgi:hypothetical protein